MSSPILTLTGNTLSKISFCDKQCSNINDNKFKAQIIDNLQSKYNIQVVTRDYNLLNPNILRNVSHHQHILSTYTNGNPYMLYLTKIDGINCTLFIDKKLKDGYTYPKMHCVKYRFSDELFEKETIFTGELVRDSERRWFFLIDNIMLYKGLATTEKNILSRFELVYNVLKNEYKADRYLEICPLQVKKLFLYKDIRKMVEEFIPNLSYVCKGIIFYTLNNKHSNYAYVMPRDSQIAIKTSCEIDDIVQEKYPELWAKKHSIAKEYLDESASDDGSSSCNGDGIVSQSAQLTGMLPGVVGQPAQIEPNNVVFKVLKTEIPDIYSLYCYDDKHNLVKHSIALIPNIKISHYLYNTFKANPENLAMKIECRYSKIFEKWIPFRIVENEPFEQTVIDEIAEKLKNMLN